jgi:hypothetical protein
MNLADVFTYLFVILGFLIAYVSYWLMAAALFPRMVERSAAQLGRAPVKTTLLGAALFVPLLAICLRLPGRLRIAGVGVALLLALAALFGSSGLALRIGQGLPSARDERQPWRRVLRGGIVLSLTFVMPLLGWFVVMPFAYLSGFGAFVLMLFHRERNEQPQVQCSPVAASGTDAASESPILPAATP